MSKKKNSSFYGQENQFTSRDRAWILPQVIPKKNFNMLIFSMFDFLKEPIIIHIGNLILMIPVTLMTFLSQFRQRNKVAISDKGPTMQ